MKKMVLPQQIRLMGLLGGLMLLLAGCQNVSSEMKRVTFQQDFSIEIPVYMEEISPLEEGVLAQYGHELYEHYVAIAREPADLEVPGYSEMFIETYASLAQESMSMVLTDFDAKKVDLAVVERNGMESVSYRVTGTLPHEIFGSIPIVYYIIYYKGTDYFYIVTSWTTKDRENQFKKNMQTSIESFREL